MYASTPTEHSVMQQNAQLETIVMHQAVFVQLLNLTRMYV